MDRRSRSAPPSAACGRFCAANTAWWEVKTEVPVTPSLWERWLQRPQKLWLRRALFQVHMWAGVGFSIYVLLMCVSGTVLIYRVEIDRALSRQPAIVVGPGARMSSDELRETAKREYPSYDVTDVTEPRNQTRPAEVVLQRGGKKLQRLFNPFTGADLGNSLRPGYFFMEWLASFHDELLYRPLGRYLNGIGGLATTLLAITGAVIWWPGIDHWRRSLMVKWKADSKRLNWALHSALGIWSVIFILLWGISGTYLAYPEPFENAAEYFNSPDASGARVPSFGDVVLDWLARLHFGRFGGLRTKIVWTIFGLVPVVLVITGIWMWWARVVRPKLRRQRMVRAEAGEAGSPDPGVSKLPYSPEV